MSYYVYNDNSIVTFVTNVFFSSIVHDTNVQVRENSKYLIHIAAMSGWTDIQSCHS